MFKYTHDSSNEAQDAFALQYGEAHLVEFPKGVYIDREVFYVGFASSYEEAKHHAQMAFGKMRGFIRASDFGF